MYMYMKTFTTISKIMYYPYKKKMIFVAMMWLYILQDSGLWQEVSALLWIQSDRLR